MKSRQTLAAGTFALLLALSGGCDHNTGPDFDPLVITTDSLQEAVAGEPYTEGINAEGGDESYTWTLVSGSLPPGLVLQVEGLTDDDALITGIPGSTGSFPFTLQVDSRDGQSTTADFVLEVEPPAPPLEILNAGLAPALAGEPYSAQLRATGGPSSDYGWSIQEGGLPPGLALVGDRIEGTPTGPDSAVITLRVTSGSRTTEEVFRLEVIPHRQGSFHITVLEVVPVPASLRPYLDAAIAEWERVIEGDLDAVPVPIGLVPASACGGFGADLNGTTIDDLMILVNLAPIDGPGKVLGRAGPCGSREEDSLPAAGVLTLDSEDLEPLVGGSGGITLRYIIAHEIGHILGIGTLWDTFDLIEGEGTSDPLYTGALGVAEWEDLGGTGSIPVENTGGEGTADAHWRETVFDTERMTGYSEPLGVPQPLSRMTLAALADLGYSMDLSEADAYSLSMSPGMGHGGGNLGYDLIYDGPLMMLGRSGSLRILHPWGSGGR